MREVIYQGRKYWAEFQAESCYEDSFYLFSDGEGKEVENQSLIYELEKITEDYLYDDWFESKVDQADFMED